MDIKEGEYVNLRNGKIDKVTRQYYMQQYIECEHGLYLRESILKHSKSLIDLIEVGDIVELELSEEFVERKDKIVLTRIGEIYTKELLQKDIDNGIIVKIKTILTKEQYKQNCYKLEKVEEER